MQPTVVLLDIGTGKGSPADEVRNLLQCVELVRADYMRIAMEMRSSMCLMFCGSTQSLHATQDTS